MHYQMNSNFKLIKKNGKYFLKFNGDEESTSVKVLWARPLTARDSEVSFVDEKKKDFVSPKQQVKEK